MMGEEDVLFAAMDEAEKLGLHTTMHHSQGAVAYANVLQTSAHGLDSMEHWYGLPEAMFTDKTVQDWPGSYVNNDEQERFGEAGRLWRQAAPPGSPTWNKVMDELAGSALRAEPDVHCVSHEPRLHAHEPRAMARYTLPALWDYYRPSRTHHGSYWFDWTTEHEMAWRENYRLWMQFVNEYKNRGRTVTVGSDSGFIYNLYGFGNGAVARGRLQSARSHPRRAPSCATWS